MSGDNEFNVYDPVEFGDGRTGQIVEIDAKNRKAKCVLDPKDVFAAGATRADWYDFDQLRNLKR